VTTRLSENNRLGNSVNPATHTLVEREKRNRAIVTAYRQTRYYASTARQFHMSPEAIRKIVGKSGAAARLTTKPNLNTPIEQLFDDKHLFELPPSCEYPHVRRIASRRLQGVSKLPRLRREERAKTAGFPERCALSLDHG
jgi:hypothetical protein